MKRYSDQIEAEVQKPMVLNPKTVNEYKDAAILSPEEWATASNVIMDDGVVEKVLGTNKQNSDTIASAVTGLHRAYGLGTEKVWLRLCNGILKSGPAAFATTVLSGLATDKITPFINVKGKTYGINETDGIIRYDPKTVTGVLTGITNPFLRKKIAFFETDETWTGGSANNGSFRAEEWTGNAVTSRQVTATTSGTTSASSNITVDLSVFANSKASDDNDYICFHTFHNTRANINYITIEFSTGDTTFTTKYQADLYQASFTVGDHEWTEWKVRKGAFVSTGSPTWAGVQAVRFTAAANANGSVTIDFDFCYLKASPPRAYELKRQIFTAENNTNETWSDNASTVSVIKAYEGTRVVRVTGTAGGAVRAATLALGTAINLSTWPNNVSSPTTDEIVFRIQTNSATGLDNTNPLNLRLGESATVYWSYTWTDKDTLGLLGNNQWFEVRIKKSSFSAVGGITLWSAIDYVQLNTSTLTGTTVYVYFDDMKMEQMNPSKVIADFEPDETWTITGNGEMSTDKNGVTEGTQCLRLWANTVLKMSQSNAVNDIATADLTTFSDSSTSDTSDYISFTLRTLALSTIEYVELWLDNNSLDTFANAYKYRVEKSEFGVGKTKEIKVQKSSFEQIGTGGGWNTIGAIKFIVSSKGGRFTGSVFIDNLIMKRKTGLTGRYYYKYTFCIGDVISATSEVSDYVDTRGSFILIDNIKTSQDSRINKRQVYRLGGDFPDTWMLVKTIDDNTTTSLVDDVDDDDLVYSMANDVPQGNISTVLGNNLVYDPENDIVYYWGDPSYKNRVYYSKSAYYHVVDETAYRTFPDDVMCVVPWFGQNIIFYKNRIQKVVGNIPTGDLTDLPINVGACSYWAVPQQPVKGLIPFAGWDNVYLFDGYKIISIGDEVKSYFKGRETYLSTVNLAYCKDTLYVACKDKTGTPTYNDTVLRCYLPTKGWTILPDWNTNVWAHADQKDDLNDLYYGDSVNGNIYSINYISNSFATTAILSTIKTGWINIPENEVAISKIEFKAKGTAGSSLAFSGFKNYGSSASITASAALTANWVTYQLGPRNVDNILRGDALAIQFSHQYGTGDDLNSSSFELKDIVLHIEKSPKRITLNEKSVTVA